MRFGEIRRGRRIGKLPDGCFNIKRQVTYKNLNFSSFCVFGAKFHTCKQTSHFFIF